MWADRVLGGAEQGTGTASAPTSSALPADGSGARAVQVLGAHTGGALACRLQAAKLSASLLTLAVQDVGGAGGGVVLPRGLAWSLAFAASSAS